MARGYNKVILIGNVARDPETKTTTNQKTFAKFTVAVNREWKDANGNKVSEADFINCQAWGKLAEIVRDYVSKGKQVMVDGRLSVRKYTDAGGVDKWITEVIADTVLLLGNKGAESGNGGGYQQGGARANGEMHAEDFPLDVSELGDPNDVDVPF